MIQNQLTTKKNLSAVGKEIDPEVGLQMIKKFEITFPCATQYFYIGRNIIDQILAQPECVGIQLIKALNESNEETFVYVGVNRQGKPITNISKVNNEGELEVKKGIVADYWKRKTSSDLDFDGTDIEWGLPE